MAGNQIYENLKSRLDFADSQEFAKADLFEKGLIATREISTALLAVYQPLRGTAIDQAEVSQAIELAYAEYISPLDIPGVGPIIEAVLDNQGGRIAGGMVKPLDALLDKYLPKKP